MSKVGGNCKIQGSDLNLTPNLKRPTWGGGRSLWGGRMERAKIETPMWRGLSYVS